MSGFLRSGRGPARRRYAAACRGQCGTLRRHLSWPMRHVWRTQSPSQADAANARSPEEHDCWPIACRRCSPACLSRRWSSRCGRVVFLVRMPSAWRCLIGSVPFSNRRWFPPYRRIGAGTERRALDFGCGAGRVLRHFNDGAQHSEISGCDIDEPSIAWARERLAPPFHPFAVAEVPGLPQPDEYFDVAWALSVFTHLTDHWAGWLLELHRVLRPSGYLIATFMGENSGTPAGARQTPSSPTLPSSCCPRAREFASFWGLSLRQGRA